MLSASETNDVAKSIHGRELGLHKWTDRVGNRGTELLGQTHVTSSLTQINGLFVLEKGIFANGLAKHFHPPGDSKRKVFVVLDSCLPKTKRNEIQDYFAYCKAQNLLDSYQIWPLASEQIELTFETVTAIVSAAKHFGIRRRDLLIAIGSFIITELVGFTAAVYRRATPYISIPTDPIGILLCHDRHHKVSIDHRDHYGRSSKGLFALPHLPIAGFYDLTFSGSWSKTDVNLGLAEVIKIAVGNDEAVFSYIEAHIEEMPTDMGEIHLNASIELIVETISKGHANKFEHNRPRFDDAVGRALQQIPGILYSDVQSAIMGVALSSALSFVKEQMSDENLSRILGLLDKAGLSTCDANLEIDLLWGYTTNVAEVWYGSTEVTMIAGLGKETNLKLSDISPNDVAAALTIVCNRAAKSYDLLRESDGTIFGAGLHSKIGIAQELNKLEDVQYHVMIAEGIFDKANPTILQNYCIDHRTGRKMKILVVMDDYSGNYMTRVRDYFEYRRTAVDRFAILPVHVASKYKTIDSVLKIVNAALDLEMSSQDLFIVVGGGTLMDIVGFAAAIYKGGTRYLKIPTTLVGIIDAGIAVKVGVNLDNHKNLIGSYFAPVACVIAPETFLNTLPRPQIACGLAEAMKMAVVKNPRLFQIIERHGLGFGDRDSTQELIQISVQVMLEELQPNLREENLKRIVDFGHEFGHIIESLAYNEIPHGECVAIGMGIATYIAYLKGIVLQSDLDKIVYLILDTELPVYTAKHDCCNPTTLWAKISTDGVENKHGMLYLVVPETIGKANFLGRISEIDAGMIIESIYGLRRYAEWHVVKRDLCVDSHSLRNSIVDPTGGIILSLESFTVRENIKEGLSKLKAIFKRALIEDGSDEVDPLVLFTSNDWCLSIPDFGQQEFLGDSGEDTESSMSRNAQEVIAQYPTFRGVFKGMYIRGTGAIVVQVICDDGPFSKMWSELINTKRSSPGPTMESSTCIVIGMVSRSIRLSSPSARLVCEMIEQDLLNHSFGESECSCATEPMQQKHSTLGALVSLPSASTVGIIGASGDIGSMLTDSLLQKNMRVVCSVRLSSLNKFRKRVKNIDHETKVLAGDVLDLTNLRTMIEEVDVLYNLAGIVTLSAQPHDFPRVLVINGFAQGVISHLIQQTRRDGCLKVIFPSTQRVHLTVNDETVSAWIQKAVEAFTACKEDLTSNNQDVYTKLLQFARDLVADNPLPVGYNVYEISKRLGEHFVSLMSRYSLVRISSVYGPTIARGFVSRAIHPKSGINSETREKRDFIYIDDVTEILLKAAQTDAADSRVFDAASGETFDLQDVWWMIRGMIGDQADAVFGHGNDIKEEMQPNPSIARRLLARDTVSLRVGLEKSIDGHIKYSRLQSEPTSKDHSLDDFQQLTNIYTKSKKYREATELEPQPKPVMSHRKPYVIVIDIGATYFRTGILDPDGSFLDEPVRTLTPSKQLYPQETLQKLQERLVEVLACKIASVTRRHAQLLLEEVAISLGAVVTSTGIIKDASILWGDSARNFNFTQALQQCIPEVKLTVLNDVSSAAWRYKDEGRFCLITVSSGLSNKIFNPSLHTPSQLDLDTAGIGGEMGHVIVNPHQVDALVLKAITQATVHAEDFTKSRLSEYVSGDAQKINAQYLGKAASKNDSFVLRLLEEADVPFCPCGNLADLCSYSSGRAALCYAKTLAARKDYGVAPEEVSDAWLQRAISTGHPMALEVLHNTTYPLAVRILQLAADIGLDKFIIVGGYALKTAGGAYLQALQQHLVHFCCSSAYFTDWTDSQIRNLVKFGIADDNDGMIGIYNYVHHLRSQYYAVEKDVSSSSQKLMTRKIPLCGAREILAKVVYAGVCTTDLQILRAERKLEPKVLGHEGVCQILEVGEDVKGVSVGSMVVLNPNNPLDEHDKLGHTVEGLFQEYFKFGQEMVDKNQILVLNGTQAHATDTLVEPLSCVIAAQQRMKDRLAGKNVLIVGAGVMGLMFVQTSIKYGARQVFLANRSQEPLDFAVAKGIAKRENTFVIGGSSSLQVQQATAGEGVDIVVVCVSMGQGVSAAQNAFKYINAGGCVYLFAGFCPGDAIVTEAGLTVHAWDIRSGWRTEQIDIDGKSIEVSGHRGSGHQDMEMAVDLIRGDPLSFSRVISHVISIDTLPEVALALTRGEKILNRPAKRVIVDMGAPEKTVELAEMFPLRQLQEAAKRPKNSISRGNLFREIGFDGETSMLGWVTPPTWQQIEKILNQALQTAPLTLKRNFIFCGTGGWAFMVDSLRDIMSEAYHNTTKGNVTIYTLSDLDPQALLDLFLYLDDDLKNTACIGISQSGTTLETVMLMNAMREHFDRAGLDYREHFMWLTDMNQSNKNDRSGEAAIRASEDPDWRSVCIMPLTVDDRGDSNALFCAPHSTPAFLTMALLCLRDVEAVRRLFQQYLELRDQASRDILPSADLVASKHIQNFCVDLGDDNVAIATERLIKQLIAQSLGSKQKGFNPRITVAPIGDLTGCFEIIKPCRFTESLAAVKAMLAMNALSVFVAVVAYHRNFTFVTHPKVELYKSRAKELNANPDFKHITLTPPEQISEQISGYLDKHPASRFLEVVCYWVTPASQQESIREWLELGLGPRASNVQISVIQNAEWNHSMYQRAVQAEDTLYVILEQQQYLTMVKDVSEQTICKNVKMLRAIARATAGTLAGKMLYFMVDPSSFQSRDEEIARSDQC